MKIQFSLSREVRPEWEGNRDLPKKEQIVTIIKALGNADLMDLADAMERSGMKEGAVDTTDIPLTTTKILLEEVGRLLPKYVVLEGLESDDGPVDIDTIVSYPKFNALSMELLMELANMSVPEDDDVKN